MQSWLAFERRWCDLLLQAMLPAGQRQSGLAAVPMQGFWPRLRDAAPPMLRHGLRASVWALTWLPLLWPGYWRTFGGLDADGRDRFLVAAHHSRFFLLRQMVLVIKLMACLACFHHEPMRQGLDQQEPS